MPPWWSRGKWLRKQDDQQNGKNGGIKKRFWKDKNKSCEAAEFAPNPSIYTKDGASQSSGFSGFDSDPGERWRLPLPNVSEADHFFGRLGMGSGPALGSVSSSCSSGSSGDDDIVLGIDPRGVQFVISRGCPEMQGNIPSKIYASGSRSPSLRSGNAEPGLKAAIPEQRSPRQGSRSPGPGLRSIGQGSRSPILDSRSFEPGSRSPRKGSASPRLKTRSPTQGSRSPTEGSKSPGSGYLSRDSESIMHDIGSRSPRSPRSPISGSQVRRPVHPLYNAVNADPATANMEATSHSHSFYSNSPPSPSSLSSTRCTEICTAISSHWKRGKLLGRGTFGHVYLGFNSESGQMCAIKEVRLLADDRTSKESLKQLNQEINLLSQLSHQNIVRYYGSELSEDTLSVYLEYVSGGSIHKLLQEYGPLKEQVIQNYTRQILSGLAYLHGRNTVHRDIKGANILVDPSGEIKLADFGMAKHITNCSSILSFKGSPYWMAPEVVMNKSGYNLAVDIWSLGCTILEMATTKPPWSKYEGVAAIFKIGNSKDLPDLPQHLSDSALDFLKHCFNRDPSARPTALELLDHPFIQDQARTSVSSFAPTRDANYCTFASRTPPILEMPPRRGKFPQNFGDQWSNNISVSNSRFGSRVESPRAIKSQPVSPCSSPVHQYRFAERNPLVSPRRAFPLAHGDSYNRSNNLFNSSHQEVRHSMASMHDPWQEIPLRNVILDAAPRR